MLTKELLKANAELTGLTDEQLSAIENLSKNDEDRVIGMRIGEVYRQEDETIKNLTGIDRQGDEKTYVYRERVLKDLTSRVKATDELTKQVADLTKEKARLENVIADGEGDGETKKALQQAQKDLASITKQFTDLKTEYDGAKSKFDAELLGIRIDNELALASKGFKFKDGLPEAVTRVVLDQAIAKIKGMNPEFVEDAQGKRSLIFKDENGARLLNKEHHLDPYTANELIANELKAMGVLDEGRKQGGGGTSIPTGERGKGGYSVDIAGSKTQVEAYEAITQTLMAQGLTKGSAAFDKAMAESWETNNVQALPER